MPQEIQLRRALVYGDGDVAAALGRALLTRGAAVRTLGRQSAQPDCEHLAGSPLDPEVAAAAVSEVDLVVVCDRPEPAELCTEHAAFRSGFERRVLGTLALLRAALPALRARGAGAILLCADVAGVEAPGSLDVVGPADAALVAIGASLDAELRSDAANGGRVRAMTLRADFGSPDGVLAATQALLAGGSGEYFARPIDRVSHAQQRLLPVAKVATGRRSVASLGVTVITGASSGLGAALARRLAGRTTELHLVARRGELLEALAEELSPQTEVRVWPTDLSDPAAVAALIASLPRFDSLVDCAGRHLIETIEGTEISVYRELFELNFLSHAALMAALAGRSEQGGRVVEILSTSAIRGRKQRSAYAGAKAALWALTNALRRARPDLHVVSVIPSTFMAKRVADNKRLARTPTTDEVADSVVDGLLAGRELVLAPPAVAGFLALEALAPAVFRRVFR
ncbi:MAG: hypothetical protein RIT45_839 [Pseudomonadota bacterium]|jgi:short-subunit dehydrogenase